MPKYIDEDGNEIEVATSLQELQAAAEAKAVLEQELSSTKEQLAKSANKDMNWKRLNNMTEAETQKLTIREMELIKRQEELEDQQKSWQQQQMDSHKTNALASFGIHDDEVRQKVLANYERIKDEAVTPEQIQSKMRDAVTIATGAAPSVRINPVFAGNSPMGMPHQAQRSSQVSGDFKDLASKFGLSDSDIKKLA